MQFNIVVCGLDSIEARRWINATLVNLVDPENPESLKPLIDGGTEGVYLLANSRCRVPDDLAQDSRDKLESFFRLSPHVTNVHWICSISQLHSQFVRSRILLDFQNTVSSGHPCLNGQECMAVRRSENELPSTV